MSKNQQERGKIIEVQKLNRRIEELLQMKKDEAALKKQEASMNTNSQSCMCVAS